MPSADGGPWGPEETWTDKQKGIIAAIRVSEEEVMASAEECGSIKAAKKHIQMISGQGFITPAEQAIIDAFNYMHGAYYRPELASSVLTKAVMGIAPSEEPKV